MVRTMTRHICFVSDEIFPGTVGGIGRLINEAAQILYRAGWRITFLIAAEPEHTQIFRTYTVKHMPGVQVYGLDEVLAQVPLQEHIPLWAFHFPLYHRSHQIALALRLLCEREPFDAVEFNDYLGLGYVTLKWRRLWGKPFSQTAFWMRIHGSSEVCLKADHADSYTQAQLHAFAMERYCARAVDGWMAPSESIAKWYRTYYDCESTKAFVSAPPFQQLGPGKSHSRMINSSRVRILFYGKLQLLKGIETFIRAAVKLSEEVAHVEFVMVGHEAPHPRGEGAYRKELERLIPFHQKERFSFHQRISLDQLEDLAKSCEIAVVPSTVETFCLAAHELNWIGIPLVLNNIPAFQDYFADNRNCRFFDGTVEGLARVLGELLAHPGSCRAWEWNAPDVVRKNRLVAAYDEALSHFQEKLTINSNERTYDQPLISIVVPYYNMHDYIDDTIASIVASNYTCWEVIIVDDGSPLPAAQQKICALEAQYNNDKRFKFIRKSNGGLGSARNAGIAHACGRYVLPLDSDDVIHSEYLALAVRALERNPELAAVSSFVSFFADGQPSEQIIDYVIPYDLDPLLITVENRAGVACSIFRRELFDSFSYDETLTSYEDWDLWWSLAEAGLRAEVMPAILYRYRRRTDSMFNTTAVTRHVHLLRYLADKHTQSLHTQGPALHKVYNELVGALRLESNALRAGGKSSEAVRDFYHELRALRESRTFRLAQRFRQAAIWLRSLRNRGERNVKLALLQIEALGDKHPEALGTEVWLCGMREHGSVVFILSPFRQSGAWLSRHTDHVLFDRTLVTSHPNATLQASVSHNEFSLLFLHHPYSGRVRLTYNNHVQEIDLYAPAAQSSFKEYVWTGNSWIHRAVNL